LCDRYSIQAITDRANLNDVAPKDVKQLEVLKPLQVPSMGERYTQSLEKEKRLEVASRPLQKTVSSSSTSIPNDEVNDNNDAPAGSKTKKSKTKNKIGKTASAAGGAIVDGALDQEDEVEEGINWSDDDE
jgi:hypothetical protein